MLPLSSCICKPLIRQVFTRPRKLNVDPVLLALLFICPCINRQSSGTWQRLRGLDFRVKGRFLKHHLSNLFQCMMFLQLVSSFVFLQPWLFDCPLAICSTWKSPLQILSQHRMWSSWCLVKSSEVRALAYLFMWVIGSLNSHTLMSKTANNIFTYSLCSEKSLP